MTKNYYQQHKKNSCKRYQNVSEEEKYKRWKKVRERYQNFTEEEKEKICHKNLSEKKKQKLVEYRRKYI